MAHSPLGCAALKTWQDPLPPHAPESVSQVADLTQTSALWRSRREAMTDSLFPASLFGLWSHSHVLPVCLPFRFLRVRTAIAVDQGREKYGGQFPAHGVFLELGIASHVPTWPPSCRACPGPHSPLVLSSPTKQRGSCGLRPGRSHWTHLPYSAPSPASVSFPVIPGTSP